LKQKDLRSESGGPFVSEERLEVVPDIVTGACSNDTAAAKNNNDNSNDDGSIILLRLFGGDGRHLVVHDIFSSCGMMDDWVDYIR
jgi:hypothetical protein